MSISHFLKLLLICAGSLANRAGGFLGVLYVGTAAGAPTPTAADVGKFAYFSDRKMWLSVRESTGAAGTYIYDRIGGGPIVADTWANIVTNYVPDAAGFAKYKDCRFRVTNVGVNGSDWQCNGTELFPVAPITLHTQTAAYGRAPSGTISTGSSGNITFGTAAPRAYTEGIFVYLPTIATTPAIAAGYHWCVMSDTTTGTLYATTWSGGVPTIGAAINFTVGASYTGVTTTVALPTNTLIGGVMGNYRQIQFRGQTSTTNNANSKTTGFSFGGSALVGSGGSSSAGLSLNFTVAARGSSAQIQPPTLVGGTGAAVYSAINTANDQQYGLNLSSGSAATDWWIVNAFSAMLLPR